MLCGPLWNDCVVLVEWWYIRERGQTVLESQGYEGDPRIGGKGS